MAKLFNPFFQAIDGNGNPLVGAKLNFYITGTTTRKDTYSNADLAPGHENANPVVADSTGRFGVIYLATDVDYKIILTDASNVTVSNGTVDPSLYLSSDSVIAHLGSLIVGDTNGADIELLINANTDAALRSNGTTAVWRRSNYSVQKFLSGSGTYTTPANCTALHVRMIGGGGGGGGSGGTTGPDGAAGGVSSFGTVAANGGGGGIGCTSASVPTAGGAGGTGGTGTATFRIAGGPGGAGIFSSETTGYGSGGNGAFGGGGIGPTSLNPITATGIPGSVNSGAGGSGSIAPGIIQPPGGGGAGEYAETHISHPAASYTYAVGGGGAGGIGTGAGAATGGAGGSGIVIVEEMYS